MTHSHPPPGNVAGCTFLIAQSKFLPMQDRPCRTIRRPRWLPANAGEAGIAYVACLNIGFDATLATVLPGAAAD
jgi:hypothetical protein